MSYDPSRLNMAETQMAEAGECVFPTEIGWSISYCRRRADPASRWSYCPEHDRDVRENYG